MKIKSLKITDYPPMREFEIGDLGNFVVIAGANGSGKSRLRGAIIDSFRDTPQVDMVLESTREEEKIKYFSGKDEIEIKKGQPNTELQGYINSRTGGALYVGSVVQIDSDRSIQNIKYNPVNWFQPDPDENGGLRSFFMTPFSNRWQDLMNYIHQKIASKDFKENRELSQSQILNKYPDPFQKYQDLFRSILPNKKLMNIDPRSPREFFYEDERENKLSFTTLSSGEQEVIKILFDVARKDIRHSVVIVDEPELHLHPNLTFKLIEALRSIGDNTNQFIFLTHSADLISTYYSLGNVYFIDGQREQGNQARKISELQEYHSELLNHMSGNLGVFAVGKKFLFVEGKAGSTDKLIYQKIAQSLGLDFTLVPLGSVKNINTLKIVSEQLNNSIFGIDFCMIRDRDGLTEGDVRELEENSRFRCLKKRHIENYFLDAEILAKVAKYFRADDEYRDQANCEKKLKEIAKTSLGINVIKSFKERLAMNSSIEIPTVPDAIKKEVKDITKEFVEAVNKKTIQFNQGLDDVKSSLPSLSQQLLSDLENGEWKNTFHGKFVFKYYCKEVLETDEQRVKDVYIDIAIKEEKTLNDIKNILQHFYTQDPS